MNVTKFFVVQPCGRCLLGFFSWNFCELEAFSLHVQNKLRLALDASQLFCLHPFDGAVGSCASR